MTVVKPLCKSHHEIQVYILSFLWMNFQVVVRDMTNTAPGHDTICMKCFGVQPKILCELHYTFQQYLGCWGNSTVMVHSVIMPVHK